MKKWMVIAPNGKSVQVSKDGFTDVTLLHRQKTSDESLVSRFPTIFVPCVSDVIKKEEVEEITEVVTEEEKQMLTEVPKPEEVAEEDDKPVKPAGTTIETFEEHECDNPDEGEDEDKNDEAPEDKDKNDEAPEDEDKNDEEPEKRVLRIKEDDYTKKELLKLVNERNLAYPKNANKKDLVKILNES